MLERIVENFSDQEILKADGFDDCVIGFDSSDVYNIRLIYSVSKIIEKLVSEGATEIDAIEHFEYNIAGGYVGEKTPIWCDDTY
jgi:hypothetical protein